MIRDLEPIREAWLKEQPRYEAFVEYLRPRVEALLTKSGVWYRLAGRPKSIDSLLKKCLRRPELQYESIPDKAGIRIVTRFLEDIPVVCRIIDDNFKVKKKEDFTEALGIKELGYQGTHLDIVLADGDSRFGDLGGCVAEVQVRTLSQDLWCEMAHELNYKPEVEVPNPLHRRVNCLSALIETCDREFSAINGELMQLPDAAPRAVLAALEQQFYKITGKYYDKGLSVDVIRALLPLYSIDVNAFRSHFEAFYSHESEKLVHIFNLYTDTPTRSMFLYQPEALMIFDLLNTDPFSLQEMWSQHFPSRELERLAVVWGTPLR